MKEEQQHKNNCVVKKNLKFKKNGIKIQRSVQRRCVCVCAWKVAYTCAQLLKFYFLLHSPASSVFSFFLMSCNNQQTITIHKFIQHAYHEAKKILFESCNVRDPFEFTLACKFVVFETVFLGFFIQLMESSFIKISTQLISC